MPKDSNIKKVRTSFCFDKELYDNLKDYTNKNMATMNKVVCRAVENFLKENECTKSNN